MPDVLPDYQWLLTTPSAEHWRRIGIQRRAGLVLPLFSIRSRQSVGIGELTDLPLVVDWCLLSGISLLQLLPLNDVGFNFTPYDAQSSLALDPMYLGLTQLEEVPASRFAPQIEELRKRFPGRGPRVDYEIKKAKLELLRSIFQSQSWEASWAFDDFKRQCAGWLSDYGCFKLLKTRNHEQPWWDWPVEFRRKNTDAVRAFCCEQALELEFHAWLQWQLFEQFRKVKAYAQNHGIFVMGDIPFLVSRDSTDVWAHQDYFKQHLSAGAPPDMYHAEGQRWGMPPYDWEAIAASGYDYLIEKLQYAQNFYDLFRIDHFIGIFRIWTFPADGNGQGAFDPSDQERWEAHGTALLRIMLAHTRMLPCAEDLGTVPDCSYRVLKQYGIVGMDIQRWERDWERTFEFKPAETYRIHSMAMIATHDMLDLRGWWEHEAGTIEAGVFKRKCRDRGLEVGPIMEKAFRSPKADSERLRWHRQLRTREDWLAILGRPEQEVKDLLDLYSGTVSEKELYWKYLGLPGEASEAFTPALAEAALLKINQTSSVFSLQLLTDWLSMTDFFKDCSSLDCRVNRPGTISADNWSLVMPFTLEELLENSVHRRIRRILEQTGRVSA
ncbi:MAG: 4-alpha-glucanotransferase [candidate division FCPU426 bacterium]